VKIGFPFFAYYRVRIYGPGRVKIGKYCSVFPNVFRGLTIITLSPHSHVIVGDECDLGGMTIRCKKRIEIGSKTLGASSLIQDTLFVNSNRMKSKIKDKLAREISVLKVEMHKLKRDRKLDKSEKEKEIEKLTKEKNNLEKELEGLYEL